MSRQSILIFFMDPLAAALLGAAVELAGYTTYYAKTGESPRAALRRTRPGLVLLDCDDVESCSDAFIGPALMTGARVVLVRTPHTQRDIDDLADDARITVVELPADVERLAALLDHRG